MERRGKPVIVLRASQKVKGTIVCFKSFDGSTKVRRYVNIKAFIDVTPFRLYLPTFRRSFMFRFRMSKTG
jgi:hypothetical protein